MLGTGERFVRRLIAERRIRRGSGSRLPATSAVTSCSAGVTHWSRVGRYGYGIRHRRPDLPLGTTIMLARVVSCSPKRRG